jgi:hypothetical protein
MAKSHTLKPVARVTLNYSAMTPGNAAYWQQHAGARVGTVGALDANGRARVEFGDGVHGLFAPESLTAETVQPGLWV